MKKLRVTVEGKAYEVLVEVIDEGSSAPSSAPASAPAAPTPAPIAASSAPAPSAKPVAGANDVVCPLAGKLVSIDVKPGQRVEEGAQVATVEAMKMNTYIFAPRAGTVATVLAQAGDGVEEGTILLQLN
jgi:biotin carboxyl carrier protein